MSTGNTYGATTETFGGGVPVWRSVDPNGKWQVGGVVASLPDATAAQGTVIATGHPVEIDTAAHTAKLGNYFKVHTAVTSGSATLLVMVFEGQPRLKAGNFIGVPPAVSGGAMTCITVGTVTQGVLYDTITITPNSLGALDQYSFLTEGIADGSTTPYADPNALTFNDVYIENDTTVATVAAVHTGTVYAERTPYMSAGVRTALPTIKFDYSY